MRQRQKALLDTSVLSAYMRGEPKVVAQAEAYLAVHGWLSFSVITRFEILRGLKARGATTKLESFEELCDSNEILPITDAVIVQAADIYAGLYKQGRLIDDADTLIAATALVDGLVLVTNNERHFSRVNDLQIENWLK